eukprot:scaffold823_cov219-Amphora_coffeaeformis.AAC.24
MVDSTDEQLLFTPKASGRQPQERRIKALLSFRNDGRERSTNFQLQPLFLKPLEPRVAHQRMEMPWSPKVRHYWGSPGTAPVSSIVVPMRRPPCVS